MRGPPAMWPADRLHSLPLLLVYCLAMSLLISAALILIAGYLVFYVFFPLGRGAIYDPSTPYETSLIVTVAGISSGEKAADLGSGDGRVVIELARKGAEAHGYEVNPVLVMLSRRNIRRAGMSGRAFVHWKSFWNVDLGRFDVITVFQVDFVMARLEDKLKKELAPSARIVSHYWRFPTLQVVREHGRVYLYKVP